MNATHEIIEYNEEMPMKLFYQRIGSVSKHWHRSLEILFVLSGEMNITINSNNYLLKEDDIIVINPNILHETFSEDCILLSLQMRLSMFHLNWLTPECISFNCNSVGRPDKTPYLRIKQILAHMLQSNSTENLQNGLVNYTYAFQLMNELVMNFKAEINEEVLLSQKALVRLRSITDYMESHFMEEVTLTEVAEHEYMSSSYLSHFFEKHMGTTFSAYLTKLRLEHSLTALYDDASIEEIAEKNGFPSPRSYSTLFKKQYGMLPSIYRKQVFLKQTTASALVENCSSNYLILERNSYFDKLVPYLTGSNENAPITTARQTKRNLGTVSVAQNNLELRHTFRNFCSVGRARELLYSDIQQMLRLQQLEMPFRYIKFHGIFDDAMNVYKEDSKGNPILNFYYTDIALDFLLEVKLKPLIQLSFMPKDLAKNPSRTLFYYPFIMSEPKDDSKWEYLVSEFVKHVIKRYGYQEVASWPFTFWNETFNGFPFDFPEVDISLRLYELSYRAVKQLIPEACFASISYVISDFPSENYDRYMEYAKQHSCLPDAYLFNFYSFNRHYTSKADAFYMGEIDLSSPAFHLTLSSDPDMFHKYIDSFRSYFGQANPSPIYITEWNFTSSHREWLNDTCFTSCYIVRNLLQNYDKMDSFCHWSLSDKLEELPPAEETFHGGMGFFTRDGIKKPAYYAYYLLTKLEDILIKQREGFFVTKNREGTRFSIILYNYHHFSDLYGDGINFSTSSTERYNAFPTACKIRCDFTLTDMTDGEYTVTQTYINRNSGSVFDKWLEMGAAELTTSDDVETLRKLSTPMVVKKPCSIKNSCYSYDMELEPHEVRLIQIVLE